MATIVREFLFQDFTEEDANARQAWLKGDKTATSWEKKAAIRQKQLMDLIGVVPCNRVCKEKGLPTHVCEATYTVFIDGDCGWAWPCRHSHGPEDYKHVFAALKVLAPDRFT